MKENTEHTEDNMSPDNGDVMERIMEDDTEAEKKEVIDALNNMDEDNADDGVELSFRTLIGGDILQSRFMLKQIVFIIYCAFLMILYTANRYYSQDEVIEIDNLREALRDAKYNELTQSSELMNYTRQSNVEEALKHTPDSVLISPEIAPYLIKKDSVDDDGGWFW